ncbi:MAG: tRNA (N6-threonylcarbamoyladenosine(37)-N6)-methyltransferase TrmO [Bacteroidales bacterium]|nr:tRNA (N6-threonylcarbamoyladenosine(37)-N6)-methyltransferase TrmO [Bacteroidales bacterium]
MMNIKEIGVVKSKFTEPTNPTEMKKHESTIIIKKEFIDGLFKIEDSEFIDVVFYFHKSQGYNLKTITFTGELKGVFASRSPRRPTSIGITTVNLLERKGNELKVTGLDAIDGTPVLDIKPCDNSVFQANNERIIESDLKSSPRRQIFSHILAGEIDKLLLKAGQLHGHFCPGLAMGVMAATYAMQKIKSQSDGMENLLAIVETNNCVSDGIQFVTACSFGNNSLIFKDVGKTAFTLTKRDGKGIRISTRPEAGEYIHQTKNNFSGQYQKVIKEQNRSDEEIAKLKKAGIETAFAVLNLDFDKIFKIEEVNVNIPDYAPSHESIICDKCGESIMSSRIIKKHGKNLCIPCAGDKCNELNGFGIRCKFMHH